MNNMKKNKSIFKNIKKVMYDGIKFDSQAECFYYQMLKQKGIKNFKMQEKFMLTEKIVFEFEGTKKTIRSMTYSPDFTFYDEKGELVKVVDVKGYESEAFKIKKKVFMARYNVPIILAEYDYKWKMFKERIA